MWARRYILGALVIALAVTGGLVWRHWSRVSERNRQIDHLMLLRLHTEGKADTWSAEYLRPALDRCRKLIESDSKDPILLLLGSSRAGQDRYVILTLLLYDPRGQATTVVVSPTLGGLHEINLSTPEGDEVYACRLDLSTLVVAEQAKSEIIEQLGLVTISEKDVEKLVVQVRTKSGQLLRPERVYVSPTLCRQADEKEPVMLTLRFRRAQ